MKRNFYRDYYAIEYQKTYYGFFKTTPAKYFHILFYEENGKFFELLTGHFLGTRKEIPGSAVYVFSDEFGYAITLENYWSDEEATCLSEERFAAEAQIYMENKAKILPLLNKKFESWRKNYREELETERQKCATAQKQQIEDQENVEWLGRFLDSRK